MLTHASKCANMFTGSLESVTTTLHAHTSNYLYKYRIRPRHDPPQPSTRSAREFHHTRQCLPMLASVPTCSLGLWSRSRPRYMLTHPIICTSTEFDHGMTHHSHQHVVR